MYKRMDTDEDGGIDPLTEISDTDDESEYSDF